MRFFQQPPLFWGEKKWKLLWKCFTKMLCMTSSGWTCMKPWLTRKLFALRCWYHLIFLVVSEAFSKYRKNPNLKDEPKSQGTSCWMFGKVSSMGSNGSGWAEEEEVDPWWSPWAGLSPGRSLSYNIMAMQNSFSFPSSFFFSLLSESKSSKPRLTIYIYEL